MHLTVKNKFFSLGGSSKVMNDKNEDFLFVEGKMFSPTKKKFVKGLDKKNIFVVRNKFWSWFSRKALIFDANEKLVATIKRDFKLIAGFTITGAEQPIYVDAPNLTGMNFIMTITMGGKVIGTIKCPFLKLTDTFEIDFEDEEDAPLLVAIIIGIDNIIDRQNGTRN